MNMGTTCSDKHMYGFGSTIIHIVWYPNRNGTWRSMADHQLPAPPCTWWKVRWESSHNWRVFQDFSGVGFLFVVVVHPFDDWGEVWITQPKNCACEAATAEAAWPTTNEVFTHRGNWRRLILCLNQWTRGFYRFDSPKLGDQRIIGTSSPNKNSVLVQYPPWLQTPGFHRPGCCRKPQTVPGRWKRLGMDGHNGWIHLGEAWEAGNFHWPRKDQCKKFGRISRIFRHVRVWKCRTLQMGLGETNFPTDPWMLPSQIPSICGWIWWQRIASGNSKWLWKITIFS